MITPTLVASGRAASRTTAVALAALTACVAHAAPLTVNVTDEHGQPLPNVAVWVDVKGTRTTAPPGAKAEMAQRHRQFEPQLLVVQTGTPVSFPNFDTVKHHVYSFSPIKPFEIKLYAGTPAAPIVFDKPGVAVLGCNIHDRMVADIVVVDSPYFARTDAQGQASLQLPPGDHRLLWWYAALGPDAPPHQQPVHVGDSGNAVALVAPAAQ